MSRITHRKSVVSPHCMIVGLVHPWVETYRLYHEPMIDRFHWSRYLWQLRDHASPLSPWIWYLHHDSGCSGTSEEEKYWWSFICHMFNTILSWWDGCSDASPGYFSLTLNNEIRMEATATRRAGLERFTFPSGSKPYFVLDLANDLPVSFAGGELNIDPNKGRITLGGRWGSRSVLLSKTTTGSCISRLLVSALRGSIIKHSHATIFLTTASRNSTNSVFGQVTHLD